VADATLWSTWLSGGGRSRIAVYELGEHRVFSGSVLSEKANAWAERLSPYGKGKKIVLGGKNSADWMVRFLAIQKLGSSAILVDSGYGVEAIRRVAHRFGADAILHEDDLEIIKRARSRSSRHCIYKVTSGSVGMPMLIPCLARHLLADGRNIIRGMGIRGGDRQLGLIPFGHSYGIGNLVMPLLMQGTPVWTAKEWTISQIPDWISLHRLNVFPSVPSVLEMISRYPCNHIARSLRLVISAGAPLSKEIAGAFFQRYKKRIRNFYGSSETGGICYDRTGKAGIRGDSVGKPLPGVRVSFSPGKRIRVTSLAVAHASRTFLLGDCGERMPSGEVKIIGRIGRMAEIGGKKVKPQEIQHELEEVHGIRKSFVDVLEKGGRNYLVAWYVGSRKVEEVRLALEKRIPAWKIPRKIIRRISIPHTGRGKVDVDQLRRSL
jgi:acyl-coenzyme A synthetase/AMP-(fatty) acid ligase